MWKFSLKLVENWFSVLRKYLNWPIAFQDWILSLKMWAGWYFLALYLQSSFKKAVRLEIGFTVWAESQQLRRERTTPWIFSLLDDSLNISQYIDGDILPQWLLELDAFKGLYNDCIWVKELWVMIEIWTLELPTEDTLL